MPEVEHSAETAASLDTVWAFVQDMDNWAPYLTGYQSHQKLSDDESIWVVKGELGGMTRLAEFRVTVTEWAGPERVFFRLDGLQEPVSGTGTFLATDLSAPQAAPVIADGVGWFKRWQRRVARFIVESVLGRRAPQPAAVASGPARSRISFRLSLNAGGAAGPIMNLLLAPLLRPVAEDLANQITAEIDRRAAALS